MRALCNIVRPPEDTTEIKKANKKLTRNGRRMPEKRELRRIHPLSFRKFTFYMGKKIAIYLDTTSR